MGGSRRNIVAAGLLALASRVLAQVGSVKPTSNDVTYKLNIPANTASSGSGDIFFQLSAPSTYEWVALGLGTSMSGSNIFVVYTSGDGNVTLSPRLASGYSQPNYNSDAQVTLLEGSGVSNGKMIANVKCSNCDSWSGGTADFKGSKGNWVYAWRSSGGPKDSTNNNVAFSKHDSQSSFSWDYASAKGGSSVNPFVNAAPAVSGTGTGAVTATASCVPRPTSAGSAVTSGASSATRSATTSTRSDGDGNDDSTQRGRPTSIPSALLSRFGPQTTASAENNKREEINYCDNSDSSNTNTGFTPILSGAQSTMKKRLAAHGILAALAFVILFPSGAIAVRLASFRLVVWFHAGFQMFAYLVYIAAFGLGVTMANDLGVLNSQHPIIGIVVFVGLFIQPFLGFLHHSMFKKYQARTGVSHAHVWFGRILIALGIVNGGLGFNLADSMSQGSKSGKIAYSVLAAIFGVAWIAAIIVGERKRVNKSSNPPKYTETPLVERSPENGHYAPTR